ncbi:MAG: HDIG domain-containing protein [Armatimonadota bacterium]|nr:HDIG domain-containing protein [Armatimonadota bacterium]
MLRTPLTVRAWLGVITAVLLSACLATNFQPQRYSLHVGQLVPRDIRAPITATFTDTASATLATRDLQSSPIQAVVQDRQAPVAALSSFSMAVEQIRAARNTGVPVPAAVEMLTRGGTPLSGAVLQNLLITPPATFEATVQAASAALALEMTDRVIGNSPAELVIARADLANRVRTLNPNPVVALMAADLAGQFVKPTTLAVPSSFVPRAGGAAEGAPVFVTIHRGDILARKGEPASQRLVDELDSLGLSGQSFLARISLVAISLGSLTVVVLFIRLYFPILYADTRQLCLLAFIVVSGLMALRFLGFALGLRLTPSQYGFFALMWVAAAGMLVATLIRAEVAVLIVSWLSLFTAVLLDNQIQFGIASLLSALVGIYSVRRIRQRSDMLRAMAVLASVNLVSVWVLTIWNIGPEVAQLRHDLVLASVWALLAGVMSPVLYFLGVAVLERLFNVTTDLTLLELCDNRQPLLKRLILEAPGTYAHSVGVASLAEAAAEAIGAEPLAVRASALYHDIGKITRPYFFVENQQGENLHHKLSPTMSAKIITAHITDGLDLARENRLPQLLIDCIQQHHGTSLVTYFYHQAIISSDSPSLISEDSFRYSGPKPQSREAGILMLADTVESVLRSTSRRNPGRTDAIVARIVQNRLTDGQLSECDLTLRELDQIQTAFTRVLTAIHHTRIEYPAAAEPMEERLTASAGSGR